VSTPRRLRKTITEDKPALPAAARQVPDHRPSSRRLPVWESARHDAFLSLGGMQDEGGSIRKTGHQRMDLMPQRKALTEGTGLPVARTGNHLAEAKLGSRVVALDHYEVSAGCCPREGGASLMFRARRTLWVVLSLVLAACGGDIASGAGATSNQVTLTIWDAEVGGASDIMNQINAAFKKQHPNISINRTAYAWSDLRTKDKLAITGPNPPDVIQEAGIPAIGPSLVQAGALVNLDAIANQYGWHKRWPPNYFQWAQCQVPIVTMDILPNEVPWVQKGDVYALIAQKPFQVGQQSTDIAFRYLEGQRGFPARQYVTDPFTIVTKLNVNAPEVQKLVPTSKCDI
jgi:hypothetical protein